jgi:hypothetical protein
MIDADKTSHKSWYRVFQLVVAILLLIGALLIGRQQLKKHFEKQIVPEKII